MKTKDKYVPLSAYYMKNWESCKHMWAMCYRKRLPLLGDNTSNRVERMFGALKVDIKTTFASLPRTVRAIIHLVEFADLRLTESYNFHAGKSLRIYSDKESINLLNQEASLSLNDKGCRIYNQTLNRLEVVRDKLVFSEGVVSEIISGKEIQYTTTCETCSCSKFSSFQAACIHILYRREDEKRNNDTFPLFCKNMFNKRYHRSGELIDILNAQVDIEVEMQDAAFDHGLVDDIMEEEVDTLVLSDRQKYNKVMPVLLRLGNLVSVHGTAYCIKCTSSKLYK